MPTDLPPGYNGPPGDRPPAQVTLTGLLALALICGTLVAVVWLLTR